MVGQEKRKVKSFVFDVFLIVFFYLAAFCLALAPFKFIVSLKERGSQDKRSFLGNFIFYFCMLFFALGLGGCRFI